jgi:hypothetical protein
VSPLEEALIRLGADLTALSLETEPRAIVDVLFASSGIEPEIVAGADCDNLLQAAEPADLAEAREALRLIAQRGFHGGKDLQSELARVVEAHR